MDLSHIFLSIHENSNHVWKIIVILWSFVYLSKKPSLLVNGHVVFSTLVCFSLKLFRIFSPTFLLFIRFLQSGWTCIFSRLPTIRAGPTFTIGPKRKPNALHIIISILKLITMEIRYFLGSKTQNFSPIFCKGWGSSWSPVREK